MHDHDHSKNREYRPWGLFDVLKDAKDHKVKSITVYPGKQLSLQRHKRRSEHWHVVSGTGLFIIDDKELNLSPGESTDIPQGALHRVRNNGDEDLIFIEVQLGDYFGEDDIERIEDDFGRVGKTTAY